jgi:hypothetical protein
MKIYRVSPVTGKMNMLDINCTKEQYNEWKGGVLIQDAMPHLSADDREFLISGCTPEDWKMLYGDGFDEEDEES